MDTNEQNCAMADKNEQLFSASTEDKQEIIQYIDDIRFDLTNAPADITENELSAYADRGKLKYGQKLKGITLCAVQEDPDQIDVHYKVAPIHFQRLRRITGYLVGDLSRWNDGKRAEEKDRVKHAGKNG